jgi:3',5'-cyclic-AMP phosphodiesterase
MDRPFLLAHLSDPHVGADWGGPDPAATLAAAVAKVLYIAEPDAVLLSGDLSDHAADDEYELVRELVAPLQAPLYVLPGNHDDRGVLRRAFGLPGEGAEPVRYSADLGPVRLVVVDTTLPGEDPGALDADQLAWLDAELADAPRQPTLVAMHHPPVATGVPAWDAIGLNPADRVALGKVIERHGQVRRLVGGHVHRVITGDLAGRPVLAVPSTYLQGLLRFGSTELDLAFDEPACVAFHGFFDGELVSHVQPVV